MSMEEAQKNLEALQAELKALQDDRESKEQAYKAKQAECAAASKELEQKLREVQAPYMEWLAANQVPWIGEKAKKLEEGIHQAEAEVFMAWSEQNANAGMSADDWHKAFIKMGMAYEKTSHIEDLGFLDNGLRLFRLYESWGNEKSSKAHEVAYMATIKSQIVGFHHTTKARHRGDWTDYEAWIGAKNLGEGQMFLVKEPGQPAEGRGHVAKFKEWKAALEQAQDLNGHLDLRDRITRNIIRRVLT